MSERKSQQELDFERKHEEDLQRLRGLRLIDDDFMAAVFEDCTCAEFLLQIIFKRDDLTVKEVHGVQYQESSGTFDSSGYSGGGSGKPCI